MPEPDDLHHRARRRSVTLTIQAALPGTLLADGETIPSPGQSVIVKLLNDKTPNDAGLANLARLRLDRDQRRRERRSGVRRRRGRRRRSRPRSPLVDPGAYSELRILGIPGNQTTGQQRVPVIITSLRDDTVGTTVRGVADVRHPGQRPGLHHASLNPARRP